jgi:membrane-associated phospholipid phosphatase
MAVVGLVALAAVAGGAFAVAVAVVPTPPTRLDSRAFDLLATTRGSSLARGVKLLAEVGPPLAALFVFGLVLGLALARRWDTAGMIVVGFPLVAIADRLAKTAVVRPRPAGMLIAAGGYSFPSAEAALSIGLLPIALAITGLIGRRRAGTAGAGAALLMIPVIGVLMISVRVHYATDVLAGWALGVAVFALTGAGLLLLGSRRNSSPACS